LNIEGAPFTCTFCKEIIEVDKEGERFIVTNLSGGMREYEHWKCFIQRIK